MDVGPLRSIEEGADGGETVVAEFEDEEAAGSEMARRLENELAVEFVAFFAAVEGGGGFVVADFDGEGAGFFAADVGGVGNHQVEKKWRVASGEWRERVQQTGFEESDVIGEADAGGVALGYG